MTDSTRTTEHTPLNTDAKKSAGWQVKDLGNTRGASTTSDRISE